MELNKANPGESQKKGLHPTSKAELQKQVVNATANSVSQALADQLIDLAMQTGIELFQDKFHEAYVRFKHGSHWEIWPVESRKFRRWLTKLFWEKNYKAVSPESVNTALETLGALAVCAGQVYPLHVRVAWHKGSIYYDLTDEEWRAVEIFPGGWNVVPDPPILFCRSNHEAPQINPRRGGDVRKVLDFINISKKDDRLLVLVSIIAACIPDIPHPIDVCYGDHGAAKTTLAEAKKSLVDPSCLEHCAFPSSVAELAQMLQHTWFTTFDNIGDLSDDWSDCLCRAVTGSGFMKRKLYTDAENVIFQYRRCIGINSINLPVKQADLLDRALLFKMGRIPKNQTRDRTTFWEEFEQEKPHILGGMFDVVAKAMQLYPTIQKLPWGRMADFGRWGCAIAEALGDSQMEFMTAYNVNTGMKNEEAILASPVAVVLRSFIKTHSAGWDGTPTDLYHQLTTEAVNLQIDVKHRPWPQAPNAFSRDLNKVKVNLEDDGIFIKQDAGGENRYYITRSSQNGPGNTTNTQISPVPNAQNINNDSSGNHDTMRVTNTNSGGDKGDICDNSRTLRETLPAKNPWTPPVEFP